MLAAPDIGIPEGTISPEQQYVLTPAQVYEVPYIVQESKQAWIDEEDEEQYDIMDFLNLSECNQTSVYLFSNIKTVIFTMCRRIR